MDNVPVGCGLPMCILSIFYVGTSGADVFLLLHSLVVGEQKTT